jgi:putative ABC transport system permease protein
VNLVAPGPKPGTQTCNQASTRDNCDDVFSYPMVRDLERVQTVFTGIAAHVLFDANLSDGRQTVDGEGLFVSGSYFPVLGLDPALGRLIGPIDDSAPGQAAVVVLSYEYWQTRFGGDPNVAPGFHAQVASRGRSADCLNRLVLRRRQASREPMARPTYL